MLIICPGCSVPYDLPPHLLGPAGARICCPACRLTFVLGVEGGLAAVLGGPEAAAFEASAGANGAARSQGGGAAFAPGPASETPSLTALRALDEPGGTLAAAAAAGRLFADHGASLLDAFDVLVRERPGEDVATEFRAALGAVAGAELEGARVGVEAGEIR